MVGFVDVKFFRPHKASSQVARGRWHMDPLTLEDLGPDHSLIHKNDPHDNVNEPMLLSLDSSLPPLLFLYNSIYNRIDAHLLLWQ